MAINFKKLMAYEPTVYDTMINSIGQKVEFMEHPTQGDMAEVIVAFPDLKLAFYSGFFECDDMMASHKEYEPSVVDNEFYMGGFKY